MKECKTGRLYRIAAICAALSFLCGIWAFNLQNGYVEERFASAERVAQFVCEMLSDYAETRLPYDDLTALYAFGLLFPFLAAFATVCLLPHTRKKVRRLTCLILGIGLLSYSAVAMIFKIVTAMVALYEQNGSPGEEALRLALLGMAEHNFFELIFIALFALSLTVTGLTGKYRPVAVSFGAICIFRLVSVNVWLITAPLEGSVSDDLAYLHGLLLFFSFALAFASAVLVSMSNPAEQVEEVES